jgi:hypothetical protein
MTRLSVMKATTRITPRQRGQTSGSISYTVGAQWELRRALARTDQSVGHYDASVRAHVNRRCPRVTARQVGFRTSMGSRSRSAAWVWAPASSSSRDGQDEPVRPPRPDLQGPVVPDQRALRDQPGPLGCPNAVPEDVDGAVRAPLLDGQRGLVPETRALSHHSGDPSGKGSITRT